MVASLLAADLSSDNADAVLRLIESYFPADKFITDASKSEINQCPTSTEEFESLIHQCVLNYLQSDDGDLRLDNFLKFIRDVEPFASQWIYTENYVRENTAKNGDERWTLMQH